MVYSFAMQADDESSHMSFGVSIHSDHRMQNRYGRLVT